MEFFDSHSHYNDESFDEDRNQIIKQTYDENITRIMCVGYNIEKSLQAIEIAGKNDFIYASSGISPNDIEDYLEENLLKIEQMAKNEKVVAIGEIGLDYHWNKENKEEQKELFIKQIDIANKYNKPIIIHTREAVMDTLTILKEHPVKNTGIFHCCPLNPELIKEGLKLGYYISFTGVITFKNAKPEESVKMVPLDRILIETDSPYMSPEPHRGTRNNSINVKYIAKRIAEIKGISIEEVAKATYNNANKVFQIKEL